MLDDLKLWKEKERIQLLTVLEYMYKVLAFSIELVWIKMKSNSRIIQLLDALEFRGPSLR